MSERKKLALYKNAAVTCEGCGLTQLLKNPSAEQFNIIYESYGTDRDRVTFEATRNAIYLDRLEYFQGIGKSGCRILDVGAGIGTFVKLCRDRGYDALGVEPAVSQCEQAKTINGVSLICEPIADVSIKELRGPVDIVHLHHVLEHLSDPVVALEHIRSLLKPDGLVVIEVPNEHKVMAKDLFGMQNRRRVSRNITESLHHIIFFSPRTLRDVVIASGYEVTSYIQPKIRRPWDRLYRFVASAFGYGVSSRQLIIARRI